MMHDNPYDLLIRKLDAFIRKYYKNMLIKGAIFTATLLLALFLVVNLLEYFGHFTSAVRTLLFYSFLASSSIILITYVFIPLLKMFKLGKVISHDQAARIIGAHFDEVKDKLLNTLQLQQMSNLQQGQGALIKASIDQKMAELSPIPFHKAVNFKKNRKYIAYFIYSLVLFLLVLMGSPGLITESTARLIHFKIPFKKPAPFQFKIENDKLTAIQQEDFKLELSVTGSEIPDAVYIISNEKKYRLTKDSKIHFSYVFTHVQQDIPFYFYANDIVSDTYTIKVFPNPSIVHFEVHITPPTYTRQETKMLKNTGDLLVPIGSVIAWDFRTENTDKLHLQFSDTAFVLQETKQDDYKLKMRAMRSEMYSISPENRFVSHQTRMEYALDVIPDLYPEIDLIEQMDSTSDKRIFFSGSIRDDYGFKKLLFVYRFLNTDTVGNKVQNVYIPIDKETNEQRFNYLWDLNSLTIHPGDQIEYYFEVWDNDGINGSKSTKSARKIYCAPTKEEMKKKIEDKNEQLKHKMRESIEKTHEINAELEKINRKLFEKKELNWEDKQQIKQLLEKHKSLEKTMDEIRRENREKLEKEQTYQMRSEKIIQKQEALQKLFDQVMSEEMKELFRQMEELLDKLDKKKLQEKLNEMKLSEKDIEKELDRTLEIFKQLEFEQKLEETIRELKNISEDQQKLSEKTLDKKESADDMLKKQNELDERFEKIEKQIDELEKKNSELEIPNHLEDTEEQQNEIEEQMQNSGKQLEQNQKKKASKSQKNASQKMKELAEKFENMQAGMQAQAQSEDLYALRQLLENLVKLSFDQEDLIKQLNHINYNDPKYAAITAKQMRLRDDASMIEDSIFALSKRNPQIESIVNREISSVNDNMRKAIEQLSNRQIAIVKSRQQMVMTSVNNLALLLDEILQQLQQQMSQQKFGKSSCNKPGKGNTRSISNMKQMQQALNKQIEELKKKQGKNQNGKKKGQTWSKELVKLAAQQEAIRNEIQKMYNQLNKGNKGSGGNLSDLSKMMEETENDLINNKITRETMQRQKEIMVRLLEHEKAEQEREMEQKRESREAKNEKYGNPSDFLEYKRIKLKEVELLHTMPPSLNPFYMKKVNEYFNTFQY